MPNYTFCTKLLNFTLLLTLATLSPPSHAEQENGLQELILEQDSQLFDVGFNQCDFDVWNRIFGKEFEFYDDRSGLNVDRQREVRSFKERCANAPELKRRLLTSRVSPLGSDGALQIGEHEFVQNGDILERAKFIHIWQFIDSQWVISRVISYDHESVKSPTPPQ